MNFSAARKKKILLWKNRESPTLAKASPTLNSLKFKFLNRLPADNLLALARAPFLAMLDRGIFDSKYCDGMDDGSGKDKYVSNELSNGGGAVNIYLAARRAVF